MAVTLGSLCCETQKLLSPAGCFLFSQVAVWFHFDLMEGTDFSLYKRHLTEFYILSFYFYSYLNLCSHDIVHFEWRNEFGFLKSQ